MTVLRMFQQVGDWWPPEVFEGGATVSSSATNYRYVSAAGYTVVFAGTGFAYNPDGVGIKGNVTRISVYDSLGDKVFEFTGVAAKLSTLFNFAFGYLRDGEDPQDPNGGDLVEHVLRGDDSLFGSGDDDDVFGGGSGGTGNDVINAGAGSDYVKADQGNDSLYGGADRDTLTFDESYYDPQAYRGIVLDVAAGTVIDCWGGNDVIGGFERFKDSAFDDSMAGSNAVDWESWVLTQGEDTLDGRGGFDWVDYQESGRRGGTRGINADLATGIILDPWKNIDHVSNVEGIGGTHRNDTLRGDAQDNEFQGYKGADFFNGRGGSDMVAFWDNHELGGTGVTINMARSSGQILNDGFGNMETVVSIERFNLSELADSFTGSDLEDDVWGNKGNDSIRGGKGGDHLNGGEGNDTLVGGLGNDDFNFNDNGTDDADHIADFVHNADELWIDSAWGGGFLSEDLLASQFRSGAGVSQASTSAHRVIYNTSSGAVYFDADGVGGQGSVIVAFLDNLAALAFDDIRIFL